jgi:small-conductance mechanosensitive channel
MDNPDSPLRAVLQLSSPQLLAATAVIVVAAIVALIVARVLRTRHRPPPRTALPARALHWADHGLEGALKLAPILAAIVTLWAGHFVLAAGGISTAVNDAAIRLLIALVLVRLGVYLMGLLLGPVSWMRTRERTITFILWVIVGIVITGWMDVIEATLNRVNILPGRSQLSLWALLKGLVVVSAFVVVASLIARAIERHVMRLDTLAVSTRVGVSKFTYFLLVGLGILLGINAAGVDVTTLNVLTGAIGIGLGFGLQSVASNFVSGFVLLIDKSIKPGDVISFIDHSGASIGNSGAGTGNFGWVQELRGRYVVVRDRDGVDTLVPNQNLITSPFINWSYSDQRVRLKLPVTVSYSDDPELALKLLVEAAQNQPRILRDPPAVSRLISFEDNGIRLEIRFWIADPVNGVNNIRSDVNRAIWRIFRNHGVTMATPQREVHLLEQRRAPPPADPGAPAGAGLDQSAD